MFKGRMHIVISLLFQDSRLHILIDLILNPLNYFHLLFVPVEFSSSKSTFASFDGA